MTKCANLFATFLPVIVDLSDMPLHQVVVVISADPDLPPADGALLPLPPSPSPWFLNGRICTRDDVDVDVDAQVDVMLVKYAHVDATSTKTIIISDKTTIV